MKSNQKLRINNVNEKGFLMKLSHVTENSIPTGDEAAERVTKYLQSKKHLKAAPPAPRKNPGNDEWHREQDRSEQRRRDELSSIEESPDMPEPGDNIRTRKTKMEGKVKKVSGDIVLFQLVDGRMMKTSIGNVIVIEKLADEDDEIMEDELNEISDTVINKWQKEKLGPQMDAAKARGDTGEEDRVYGKIIKSTKHMGDNFERRSAQNVAAQQDVEEGKVDYNFSIEDLKRLEQIRDLHTLKVQAMNLISKPSIKPMKPEKIEWFKNSLERMNSPTKVIKLMYDLLLSGEGNSVIGTRSSMKSNDYRQRFGEQGVAEADGLTEDSSSSLPDVLYHGGEHLISKFKIPPFGVFFSPHKEHAEVYGDAITRAKVNASPVYLVDYDEDIDEDIIDALFDRDYRKLAKYVRLLQSKGYKALQTVTDSEMVCVFPGGDIQVLPSEQGVAEGDEINNPADTVTVDVPLLIRIMEYAKEDAKTDLDLHNAAEKLIELSQEGRTLTMDDYATMIGDVNEGGMGGINRSAPSNDVSYQDVLDDSTDEWRGDTVKVEDVAQPLTREALRSRQKELQRIQMDPETSRSPLMKKELAKKIAQLRQQAEASNLVDTYESKLSKFLEDDELS